MRWVNTMRARHGLGWLLILLLIAMAQSADPVRGAEGDGPVAAAAKAGDLAAVRDLIKQRADVNLPTRDGSTALLWAAYNSDLEMTRVLLAAGAKVNVANRYGVAPLLQASRIGDVPIMEALLTAGANPKLAHPEGETPLMASSRAGRVEAVRLLLARGADVNAADAYQGQTALMWAATEGHVTVVKTLLEAGADPNIQARVTKAERGFGDFPSGGFTALMFAARDGREEIVRELAAAKADFKLTNGDAEQGMLGATAPIIAIVNDRFDLAALMFDLGADPNDGSLFYAVDMHDATTDMYARDGSLLRWNFPNKLTALDLIKLLLDKGADPNKPFVGQLHSTSLGADTAHNGTPLYRAAIAADVEVIKMLAAKGANANWVPGEVKLEGRGARGGVNGNVSRPMIFQAMTGGRGAPFGGGPGFGRIGPPPWREAGNRKPVDAVKALVEAGADINAWDPAGNTPIHVAAAAGNIDMIKTLAELGAKLDANNRDGKTALDIAEAPLPARGRGRGAMPMNMMMDDDMTPRPRVAPREEVAALLRELQGWPAKPATASRLTR